MASKILIASLAVLGIVSAQTDEFSSYFNKVSEFKPPGGGSFPTMPSGFGEVPGMGGSSSSSSAASSGESAPSKRQAEFNEYFNKVSEFKPPGGGSFPTMPSGFGEVPGMGGSSSSSAASSGAEPAPAPSKRQAEFSEYFNKVSEFKPPGGGSFPTVPSGFGEVPGMGGSSSSSSAAASSGESAPTKRQAEFNEYFNKVSEFKPPGGGSFPTMPSGFGEVPGMGGSSSSSSAASSGESAPSKRQAEFSEYFNKVSEFKPPGGGSFPTVPSGFGEVPGMGGSSSSSSAAASSGESAPSKRQAEFNEYFNKVSEFKPPGGGSFPTMPSGFGEVPGMGGSSSSAASSGAASESS